CAECSKDVCKRSKFESPLRVYTHEEHSRNRHARPAHSWKGRYPLDYPDGYVVFELHVVQTPEARFDPGILDVDRVGDEEQPQNRHWNSHVVRTLEQTVAKNEQWNADETRHQGHNKEVHEQFSVSEDGE